MKKVKLIWNRFKRGYNINIRVDYVNEVLRICCIETHQRVPETTGEIAQCVFNSLAHCYKNAVLNLEAILDFRQLF